MEDGMKIVAFLQNQWFKNPEKAKAIFVKHPDAREELIARFLFAGCLTGKRLAEAFGDWTDKIIWEEISRDVGGHSAAAFRPDMDHIREVILKHKPYVVLAFGKIAHNALTMLRAAPGCPWHFISACHPAARGNDTMVRLHRAAYLLKYFVERISEESTHAPT
jgi:hypothetical protein